MQPKLLCFVFTSISLSILFFYLDSFCLTLLADCPVSYFVQSHIDRSVAYLTPSNVRLCESTAAPDRSRCESLDHHVWIVFISLVLKEMKRISCCCCCDVCSLHNPLVPPSFVIREGMVVDTLVCVASLVRRCESQVH